MSMPISAANGGSFVAQWINARDVPPVSSIGVRAAICSVRTMPAKVLHAPLLFNFGSRIGTASLCPECGAQKTLAEFRNSALQKASIDNVGSCSF
jgi:hypothetical protein